MYTIFCCNNRGVAVFVYSLAVDYLLGARQREAREFIANTLIFWHEKAARSCRLSAWSAGASDD